MAEETDSLLLVEPSKAESGEGPAGWFSLRCSRLCLLRSPPLAEPSSIPADGGPREPRPADPGPSASLGGSRNREVSLSLNCAHHLSEVQV